MHVAIELSGHWDLVEPTGELLRRATLVALGEGPGADQVNVASRELLENTVKYSQGDEAVITLQIAKSDRTVRITVENRPDPVHVETLRKEIEALSQVDEANTLQHYVSKMELAAAANPGKSGLGLARIRYECGMALSMETVGKRVRIVAHRRIER